MDKCQGRKYAWSVECSVPQICSETWWINSSPSQHVISNVLNKVVGDSGVTGCLGCLTVSLYHRLHGITVGLNYFRTGAENESRRDLFLHPKAKREQKDPPLVCFVFLSFFLFYSFKISLKRPVHQISDFVSSHSRYRLKQRDRVAPSRGRSLTSAVVCSAA